MIIQLKRVYETSSPKDGYRVLVDRLWPRGISKEKANLDEWNKNLAPSNELRKWFHHDPSLWKIFTEKYTDELKSRDDSQEFLERNKKHEVITLIYAEKDQEHCHPLVLQSYLQKLIKKLKF